MEEERQSTNSETSLMKIDEKERTDNKPGNNNHGTTPTNSTTNNPPVLESEKYANSVEKDIDTSKICSPSTLMPNTTASSKTPSNYSVLRPSQLTPALTNKTPFSLNPSRFNPPNSLCSNGNKSHVNGESLKFVPLITSEKSSNKNPTPVTTIPETTFVFGQNIQDRVIAADGKPEEAPKASTSLDTNGTLLFSSAVSAKTDGKVERTKSLSESAREYEESRAVKRKYDEVEVKTGEEEETNILHMSCKLFAFDKGTGSWQERGHGNLRLNDFEVKEDDGVLVQSRLVFRSSGSFRVILNTKIWPEMTIQEASKKSVRFTAMDNGEIRIFLVMASKDEIKQLYEQLNSRVKKEIDRLKSCTEDNKKRKKEEEEN